MKKVCLLKYISKKTLDNMSDKKQTAFRISEGLLKRLKAEAKKQNRSVNNLVEVLIEKHVPKL